MYCIFLINREKHIVKLKDRRQKSLMGLKLMIKCYSLLRQTISFTELQQRNGNAVVYDSKFITSR
jgi:hypothetical protein